MSEPTPLNTDIDPRASQRVAAQKRARPAPVPEQARAKLPVVPIAVVGAVLVVALLFTRLPSVPPMQIAPTEVVKQALSAPSSTPVLPTNTPAPTIGAENGSQEPSRAQTGRGLAIDQVEPTPAPTYLENVAAQVPHCVRSCGGVAVALPTAPPEMIAVIQQQAPHKVR